MIVLEDPDRPDTTVYEAAIRKIMPAYITQLYVTIKDPVMDPGWSLGIGMGIGEGKTQLRNAVRVRRRKDGSPATVADALKGARVLIKWFEERQPL